MSDSDLLDQAGRVLKQWGTGGYSPRMAAFLARRALEETIDSRYQALVGSAPPMNVRSKLVILRVLDTPEAADRAAYAWNRLSNACHLHAFEMQPSVAEVERLCEIVSELRACPLVGAR